MAFLAENSSIKSQFKSCSSKDKSFEELINELLQQQTQLNVRLAALELPCHSAPCSVESAHLDESPNNRWSDIVKGKRAMSLPLFDPRTDKDYLPLSNFFAPLAELTDSPAPGSRATTVSDRRTATPLLARKRSAPATSSTCSRSPSPAGKHPRLSGQATEASPDANCTATALVCGLQTAMPVVDAPVVTTGNDVTITIPSLDGAPPNIVYTIYSEVCDTGEPEFLVVRDSIVRFVEIPNGSRIAGLVPKFSTWLSSSPFLLTSTQQPILLLLMLPIMIFNISSQLNFNMIMRH